MSRDDIIEMAKQAWLNDSGAHSFLRIAQIAYAAGAAAEREACLAVAEAELPKHEHFDDQRAAGNTARRIMAGIKARGQA